MAAKPAAILPADLGFFSTLASAGNLSAAARELGVTTPAVSKHLALMESRLGVPLVNRTTRRMSLTPDGERYLAHARRILGDIQAMESQLAASRETPQGLLRVNATLGFGRSHVAPMISRFVRRHPQVQVQLDLSVMPPPLGDDAFDVCIRFGALPDARVIARRLAPNRRLLCAAPAYLARRGEPQVPADLTQHDCIAIRQGEDLRPIWRLASTRGGTPQPVRIGGTLATNDGEIAVQWALDGHGILQRAEWDIERHLRSGRLVQVLPQYATPEADIHAVYPQRHQAVARVRAFVDFAALTLNRRAAVTSAPGPQSSEESA